MAKHIEKYIDICEKRKKGKLEELGNNVTDYKIGINELFKENEIIILEIVHWYIEKIMMKFDEEERSLERF